MKAADSYTTLLRGVSQQVPQDRAEGQHTEQVNMLSDPVNGLTRRHGTRLLVESTQGALSTALWATYVTDTDNYKSLDFEALGKKYVISVRRAARPVGSNLPLMIVYNKTDNVFVPLVRNVTDAQLDLLESGGVSAITGIGKYLFVAGNTTVVSGNSDGRWASVGNTSLAVAWVRGGAYSRTYTLKIRRQNNSVISVSYTTPSSSYQGVLSTSDIPVGASDYTKQVNDRVNAYNGAVTAWIGTAAAAIQPNAIAANLASLVNAQLAGACGTVGSHVVFNSLATVQSIEVSDGGDGSLIRGVADEVESVDSVSVIHYPGKVVKVRSRNASEAFYLKAVAKDKAVTSAYTEVTWVEGAGVEHSITGGLFFVTPSAGNFAIASTSSLLGALVPGTHPTFSVSTAGDADSAPAPYFVGKVVTYLGSFQNRLLVGSGGVLAVSKTEDYLNFFRSTVLTLPGDDPFEMQPTGSESDNLRASTLYDQDLVIFGDKRQYVVSGSTALTPTSANMAVMSSFEGVADASPTSAGGFIFYCKSNASSSSLFQIQPGQTAKSPESYPASSQLDSYLRGKAIETLSFTGSPSILFLRTAGNRNGIYTFSYLDKPDGRKMDSWSRWEFNQELGVVVGASIVPDGLVVVSLRQEGSSVYFVADLAPLATTLSTLPYLDSLRPYASVLTNTGTIRATSSDEHSAAFGTASSRPFSGAALSKAPALVLEFPGEPALMVGANYESYFTPTNPFMRDGNQKAIMSGRLTLTRLLAGYRRSSGLSWVLDNVTTAFNGRVLGDPNNLIGVEPISDGQISIPIGKETREYMLTIKARKWFPLTVTALEWAGQFFNRVQRF